MSAAGDITVVGGGWSASAVDLAKLPGMVIAVNDSAILLPRWDIAVSMDRRWTENRFQRLVERSREGNDIPRPIWLRKSAVQNIPKDILELWQVAVFDCDHETSEFTAEPGHLNGTNSGGCALNLAWQLKPRRVFLVGFDMNTSPGGASYWYPPYPWTTGGINARKYGGWAKQFDRAASAFSRIGCTVYNVSPSSEIPHFPKVAPREFERMTR